jgi:hypothetical protein
MRASNVSNHQPHLQELLLWPQFEGVEWQLPVSPGLATERILIGWSLDRDLVDAEVPPVVARLIATTLCRHATLTFASAIRAPFGATLLPRSWRLGQHFQWITTADPEQATNGIFYTESFSWSQQGQVVVLSQPNVVPALEERHLELAHPEATFPELVRAGAVGLMLPGVDGQVAGLYVFDEPHARRIIHALKESVKDIGAGCAVCVGDDFRARLKR